MPLCTKGSRSAIVAATARPTTTYVARAPNRRRRVSSILLTLGGGSVSAEVATYPRQVSTPWFASPTAAAHRLGAAGYLADGPTATTAYLAGALGKPLL